MADGGLDTDKTTSGEYPTADGFPTPPENLSPYNHFPLSLQNL
jgi:hypothetical protein